MMSRDVELIWLPPSRSKVARPPLSHGEVAAASSAECAARIKTWSTPPSIITGLSTLNVPVVVALPMLTVLVPSDRGFRERTHCPAISVLPLIVVPMLSVKWFSTIRPSARHNHWYPGREGAVSTKSRRK